MKTFSEARDQVLFFFWSYPWWRRRPSSTQALIGVLAEGGRALQPSCHRDSSSVDHCELSYYYLLVSRMSRLPPFSL